MLIGPFESFEFRAYQLEVQLCVKLGVHMYVHCEDWPGMQRLCVRNANGVTPCAPKRQGYALRTHSLCTMMVHKLSR